MNDGGVFEPCGKIYGQGHGNRGTLPRQAFDFNFTAQAFQHLPDHRKTKPCAMTFCCEIRQENFVKVIIGNTTS